ncbi:MAG TPA: hypothetical protein VIJ15_10370 [Dermatophilaceae bacterium]
MAQPSGNQQISSQDSGQPAETLPARVRTRVVSEVAVVEVMSPLDDVFEELDLAIELALAESPRGVVCDLEDAGEGAGLAALEMLATAGRHVRDWPGTPVAVASPNPRVRQSLTAHPLGQHLMVTESILPAVSAVLALPALTAQWLRLSAHPASPDTACDFVTRALIEWGLGQVIPSASLAVSELVASSTMNAGTEVDLSVVKGLGAIRLAVRDDRPDLRRQPYSHHDAHGRMLSVIAVLSRTFGVLPTADGDKVIWAVLSTARSATDHERTRCEAG